MLRTRLQGAVSLIGLAAAAAASAQEPQLPATTIEEIVVTGTKRAGGVSVQEAPIAVTAFGQRQLDAAHLRDLSTLAYSVPNVQLEGQSTFRGYANFSIRGMGIYSSIPSSTPTVGVFVDDMYLGVNAGTVFDTFDLAGIEILRGPQGLLFGRNVTAGAVLMRTSAPTEQLAMTAKASVETGPSYTVSSVLSGPLSADSRLKAKLGVYRNDDQGYFHNLADDNDHFGESETLVTRAALEYEASEEFAVIVRYEHGATDGDGPAGQNHAVYARDSFDFALDTTGFLESDWDQAIATATLDVGFGEGTLVNILGWRKFSQSTLSDVDSTPLLQFNFATEIRQHQWSDELRYSGTFGRVAVTSGLYYYTDELDYIENRVLAGGAVNATGGGVQSSDTWAVFSQFDVEIVPTLTLNLGARYSRETKDVKVQRVLPAAVSPCSIDAAACTAFNFRDSHDWPSTIPKVGLQWSPGEATHAYALWTKGFRSGGYNLRNTSPAAPGPYDQEQADAYEIGLKHDFLDRRIRANLAVFRSEFQDLQRDVAFTDPVLGSVQISANTADVTISGVEAEVSIVATQALTLELNGGYTESEFDSIRYDLSGNGTVGPEDFALQLPRLVPWSYGASVAYRRDVGASGELSGRVGYNHRDRQFSTDNNRGVLNEVDMLDADLTVGFMNDTLRISVYGRNLLDETTFGADTPFPFSSPLQTNSPLNKGRVLGVEIQYTY